MRRAIRIALALTTALSLASVAAAQPAEPEVAPLAAEAQATLDDIERLGAEFRELVAKREGQVGDERRVTALQARKRLIDFMRAVEKLVANVLRQQEKELDASRFVERTRTLLQTLDRRIPKFIDDLREENIALRSSLEDASPEAVSGARERIRELDEILDETFRFTVSHLQHLESLGLPSERAQADAAKRLNERAESLSGHLELARERLDAVRLESEAAPGSPEAEAALRLPRKELDRIASSLWTTCDVMDELGLETAEYRQSLITATGEVTTDLLDLDVVRGLADTGAIAVGRWLERRGPAIVARLGLFIGILAFFWMLGRVARRFVARLVGESGENVSELARRMIVGTASRVVFVIGFFIALSQVGVNVTALLAGLGIAGFIVGFALQETLGNFASGAMILMYRPFDVGDVIEASGVLGTVDHMNMVSTRILTFDNQTMIVPNRKLWSDVIRNVTAQKIRRVDLRFPLAHDVDVARAEELFAAMCREYPTVLKEPAPAVRVHEVTESAVLFVVRPWVKTADYWQTYWDLNREAMIRFARAGMRMGAPQDVRVEGRGPEPSPPR